MADSCWPGFVADGKKKSPSGKKTKSGAIKMVNDCVKKGSINQLRQEIKGFDNNVKNIMSKQGKSKEEATKILAAATWKNNPNKMKQERATGLKNSDYSSLVNNVNQAGADAINLVGPDESKTNSEEETPEEDTRMSRRELRKDKRKQNRKNRSGASSRPAF